MISLLAKKDVVLFGEFHNNPIAHWLERTVAKDPEAEKENSSSGAEMFEADNQQALTDYLKRKDQRKTDSSARLWNNLKPTMPPLIEFCQRDQGAPSPLLYPPVRARFPKKDLKPRIPSRRRRNPRMAPLPMDYDSPPAGLTC